MSDVFGRCQSCERQHVVLHRLNEELVCRRCLPEGEGVGVEPEQPALPTWVAIVVCVALLVVFTVALVML